MLRLKALLAVVSVIGLIALYVQEFQWFDRTIGMRSLALWSIATGALAGAGLGWHFSKRAESTVEKVQLYVFFIVMLALFAPFFASGSNRLLSFSTPRAVPVEFFDEQAYLSDRFGVMKGEEVVPTGYYTFFYYLGKLRRVKSKKPLLPGKKRGETAALLMKRGLWGYEVVIEEGR